MTRFARARGSKASNERLPEIPTSWSIMKQQFLERNFSSKNSEDSDRTYTDHTNIHHSGKNRVSSKIPDTTWEEFPVPARIKQSEKNFANESTKPNSKSLGSQSHLTDNQRRRIRRIKNASFGPSDKLNYNQKINDNNSTNEIKKKKKRRKKKKNLTDGNLENEKNCEGNSCFEGKLNNNEVQVKSKKIKKKKLLSIISDDKNVPEIRVAKKSKKRKLKEMHENMEGESIKMDIEDVKKNKKKRKQTVEEEEDYGKNGEEAPFLEDVGKQNKKGEKNSFNKFQFPNKQDGHGNGFKQYKNNFHTVHESYNDNYHPNRINIGGNIVEIGDFQGFPVKKEDADRLYKLRKELIKRGIPRMQIEIELKAERRRAEKALAREKKIVCFKCRKFGHNMAECPELSGESEVGNMCFKCGSTEHTYTECRVVIQKENFKFAQCFICKEQGHIARQCPDNPRGLYPKGGGCKVCGDVTHLKKDCPELINEKEKNTITVATVQDSSLEVLDEELSKPVENNVIKKIKKVKF